MKTLFYSRIPAHAIVPVLPAFSSFPSGSLVKISEKITAIGVNAMMFVVVGFHYAAAADIRNRRPREIKGEILMIENNFNRVGMRYFFFQNIL